MVLPQLLIWTPLSTMLFSWIMMSIVPIAGRLLAAFGVGIVTFTGLQVGFGQLEGYIQGVFSGLDATIVSMIAMTRIDDAVSMVLSAMSAKLVLKLAGQTASRAFKLKV